MADKDIISEAREAFEYAQDAEAENRATALEDTEFARLGEQWPEQIRKQREREGRPCLTINRLPAFARQVVNDIRMNRPQIKVVPVGNGADQVTAQVFGGLIKNIEAQSNADIAYDTAAEAAIYGGLGYFRISTDYADEDSFDLDLKIEPIFNPFTVYGDPKGAGGDSSDWNFAFVTELLRADDFKRQYPDAQASSWEGDRDDENAEDGEQVRVAEYWRRSEVARKILMLRGPAGQRVIDARQWDKEETRAILESAGFQVAGDRDTKSHKVMQYLLTGGEVLSEVEWAGKYVPILPVYGEEINVAGKKYFRSLVHNALDAQRQFNFWRTATTELVALAPKAPWIGPTGAFQTDRNKWATANTKSHAYLEYDGPQMPQRQPFAGVPAGALQEALNASDDMKSILGIYDASLGARSNETSGKAIMARQMEGDVSTFHFADNLNRAIRHAGRILVDLIPQVYTAGRIVRILSDEGESAQVPLGQPIQGQPGEPPRVFDLSVGKYDVEVKAGPSFTTRREEARAEMAQVLQAAGNSPAAPVLLAGFIKNSDWPGADKIAAKIEATLPPQLQDGPQSPIERQMAQQIAQMQQALQQAGQQVQQLQGELQNKQAETLIKAKELEVKEREVNAKALESINAARPSRKVVQITAPSGQVYTGEVADVGGGA